jgi:NCS1 family nucleobase:cation symporter-1
VLSFAALWISMSACIPTYMLASSLIGGGMNWWQAVLTIFLGNLIVLVPMILNAHAGTKYGIPFPVYCRAAFGTLGANIPGPAARPGRLRLVRHPDVDRRRRHLQNPRHVQNPSPERHPLVLGITGGQFLCFLFFWGINMWVIHRGIDTIRFLLNIKAPLLIALGLALLWWAYRAAGGFGPILSQPSAFDAGQPKAGQFWTLLLPRAHRHDRLLGHALAQHPRLLALRETQRDQVIGQALGLPTTMALYSFIGVAVTSATTIIYGRPSGIPVDVLTRFKNPVVLIVAMVALCIATLATNIAANVVSPANDFAHLAPRKISFRTRRPTSPAIIGV